MKPRTPSSVVRVSWVRLPKSHHWKSGAQKAFPRPQILVRIPLVPPPDLDRSFRDIERINSAPQFEAGPHRGNDGVGAIQAEVVAKPVDGLQSSAVRAEQAVHPK
jgi:hypothetical protein